MADSFDPKSQAPTPKAFLLMAPSITPIESNNAAFRRFSLSKDNLQLKDYTQYYMDFSLSNGKIRFAIYLRVVYTLRFCWPTQNSTSEHSL